MKRLLIVSKVQSIMIECELNIWIGGNLASPPASVVIVDVEFEVVSLGAICRAIL